MIVMGTPAGLENFFREAGDPPDRAPVFNGPPPDDYIKRLIEVSAKHGIEIVPPS
jgi:hypothetical protein